MKPTKMILACTLVLALLLAGCATSDRGASSWEQTLNQGSADGSSNGSGNAPYAPSVDSVSTVAATYDRKVIYSYDYSLETTEMDATLSALESAVQGFGGYIEQANYSGRDTGDQYSNATLTCRIPIASIGKFKLEIENAGQVTTKNEQGVDITEEYIDIETRLLVLKTQEERLLVLLEQSGNLSDLLEIERELARIRTEIEQLTGSLQKLNNLVDLATFIIRVRNVTSYSPKSEEPYLAQLRYATQDSLNTALGVLKALLIMLVYAAPYLIVFGLLLLVILLIVRHRSKVKKRRQHKAMSAPPYLSANPPTSPPLAISNPAIDNVVSPPLGGSTDQIQTSFPEPNDSGNDRQTTG
ncbi:MAG: DUF4349 domain-containing protein [Coriobacteriales bacterium]|jgi:hypothetical protein|nr:DUF4349 domain-containing protein [Coriobacteriales bacterium]